MVGDSPPSLMRWLAGRIAFALLIILGMRLIVTIPTYTGPFAWDYITITQLGSMAILALFLYEPVLSRFDGAAVTELAFERRSVVHFLIGSAAGLALLVVPILAVSFVHGFPDVYVTTYSLALVVAISMNAAIVEEILFRGFLLQFLMRFLHPVLAVLMVALVFMALHLDGRGSLGLFSVFLTGLSMTAAFFIARTLWLSIGIHFGWDFILFAWQYLPSAVPNVPRRALGDGNAVWLMYAAQGVLLTVIVGLLVWRAVNGDARTDRPLAR